MTDQLITKQIEFELTNNCNANCLFCPRHDSRKKGFISLETIKAGVALAKAAGIKSFKISGFGEPLLHPNLIEFIRYIKAEIPTASILLITNGSLLSAKIFDQLAMIPVTRINISFNGFDRPSYEKLMAGLKYDQIMNNLKYIATHNHHRVDIQFVPVINKLFGQEEFKKMATLLKREGFSDENFKFHHTITWRAGKLNNPELVEAPTGDNRQIVCLANLSTLYIDWQGKIHLCCNDIYGEAIIGTIDQLRTKVDLLKLEAQNVTLRANYQFDVCQKCDTPLTAPHEVRDGQTFTKFS